MLNIIKKIILSSLSILGISTFVWIVLLLNPNMVYSSSTQIDNVTVYHNHELEAEAKGVIQEAIKIIGTSSIYDDQIEVSMCMNDGSYYPELYPFAAATAYAFLNKTVMYNSTPSFRDNITEFSWAVNEYETRKYNLTYLLAHEFMHNVQYDYNAKYQICSTFGKINWKLEGHADYIARKFKNDGLLASKINNYLFQVKHGHKGVPVFTLEDGTIQNLSYYKYALVIQYLFEEKGMNYNQICQLETSLDMLYFDMIEWSNS